MRFGFSAQAALMLTALLAASPASAFERTGIVQETMDSGMYTYLRVETSAGGYWAAAPQFPLSVGDRVDVSPGNEMKDFFSPGLKRTFDRIIFTSSVKVIGKGKAAGAEGSGSSPAQAGPKNTKTVEQVYAQKSELKGQKIQVRGKVVKVNFGIMGKNFIHIQDGTGREGSNDLTVTSIQEVKVGDRILATGVLDADKNIGAGYKFSVILEDAALQVE